MYVEAYETKIKWLQAKRLLQMLEFSPQYAASFILEMT